MAKIIHDNRYNCTLSVNITVHQLEMQIKHTADFTRLKKNLEILSIALSVAEHQTEEKFDFQLDDANSTITFTGSLTEASEYLHCIQYLSDDTFHQLNHLLQMPPKHSSNSRLLCCFPCQNKKQPSTSLHQTPRKTI